MEHTNSIYENDVHVGTMRIAKPQYKALLVFSQNDQSCQAWKECFEQLGFGYDVASTETGALDSFQKTQHHLIVIDDQCRNIDTKQLCRLLRGTYMGTFTTIVALVSKRNNAEHVTSARSLLEAGFNQLIHTTANTKDIKETILQLEAGPLTLQLKFRSCQAVFSALERSRDLIQIADENYQIQYVNKTFEQVTGYSATHVIGHSFFANFERRGDEQWQKIKEIIQLGREWNGDLALKHIEGKEIHLRVFILPLTSQNGSIHQYVIVSQPLPNNSEIIGTKSKNAYELARKLSGTAEHLGRRLSAGSIHEGEAQNRRGSSLTKIQTLEAPITQIIKLITVIKESSQPSVSGVLRQILDILVGEPELYAPADLANSSHNPMLTDFVEGLVTGTGFTHRRLSGGTSENLPGKSPPSTGFRTLSGSQSPTVTTSDPLISACLTGSDSWNYDILKLERVTIKKPLVHLGMHILNQYDACDVLNCTPSTLHSWLVAIESNYHSSNPYHNSTHAADVLHATAYFLRKDRVKMWMEQLDEVAALLAAIIHDVDHPGRTNAFLINSNNPLALLYNDTAVLESHHAAFAFKFTVNNDNCNIFKNTPPDAFRNLRQSVIDMVLATELSKHFEHVNKFISVVTKSNNSNSTEQGDGLSRMSSSVTPTMTYELRVLIKRIMIKIADVINPARTTPLCIEWARRISEEYFSQTDEEKRLGLPVVMPHFDRSTCSLPKSQTTFIDYFLTSMCEAWHEFCGMEEVMSNLNKNYNYWKSLQEESGGESSLSDETNFPSDEVDDAIALENHAS